MRRRLVAILGLALVGPAALAAQTWFTERSATAALPAPGSFVEVEGIRLHFVCAGVGQAILLIHGNPGSVLTWHTTVLPPLAARHRVCAVDRPGHGLSERGGDQADSVEGQARLLHGAARRLGLRRPVLVGHSWGGAAALAYAVAFPEDVAGLALLAGVAYPDASGFADGAERIALLPVVGPVAIHVVGPVLARPLLNRSLDLAFAPDPVPAGYRDRVIPVWARPTVLRAISADNAALSPGLASLHLRYGEIRAPAAILVGDADRLVNPARHSFRLKAVLPRATLAVFEGAGHELHQTRTGPVVEAILALRAGAR